MSASLRPETRDNIIFSGEDGLACEDFVKRVQNRAFTEGRSQDHAWTAALASTCLSGLALRWFDHLDEDTQADWLKLRRALFDAYPRPSVTQSALATSLSVGAARPDFGQLGTPIQVDVNCFGVKFPDTSIQVYDVAFLPPSLSRPRNIAVMNNLMRSPAFTTLTPRKGAYDGKQLFFHTEDLGAAIQFQLQPGQGSVGLRHVATTNPGTLLLYLRGRSGYDNARPILHALNVAFNASASSTTEASTFRNHAFPHSPTTNQPVPPWSGHFEPVRGHTRVVRPAIGRSVLKISPVSGIMIQEQPLINLCLEVLGEPHMANINRLEQLSTADRGFLSRLFRSSVLLDMATGRRVRELTGPAALHMVDLVHGQAVSLALFYQMQGIQLAHPDLPVVQMGGRRVLPIELCYVRRCLLRAPQVLNAARLHDFYRFASPLPHQAMDAIRGQLEASQYSLSPVLLDFNIHIDPVPLRVQARTLPSPTLKCGHDNTVTPSRAKWQMETVWRGAVIKGWIIICYAQNVTTGELADFAERIHQQLIDLEVQVETPPVLIQKDPGDSGDVVRDFRLGYATCAKERSTNSVNFVMAVLPDRGQDLYVSIKHAGDIAIGVATQCLQARECQTAREDIIRNLCFQINARLGGVNFIPKTLNFSENLGELTLILGAHVSHPPLGGAVNLSLASLVGNLDISAAEYVAVTRPQMSRVELVEDLEFMTMSILHAFSIRNQGKVPSRIVYYRQGLGQGASSFIKDREVHQLRVASRKAGLRDAKVTCIVVTKNHRRNLRMFPVGAAAQNVLVGTILDAVVADPVEFDFYMQAHAGNQGTSHPTHFHVLVDESRFSSDVLQQFTFDLCHLSARCTQSVSVPASLYYARLASSREKIHFCGFNPGDNNDLAEGYQTMIDAFRPIHPALARRMYFV